MSKPPQMGCTDIISSCLVTYDVLHVGQALGAL